MNRKKKDGSGIFGNIKSFSNKLRYGRRDYSPSVKKILEKYGNEIIKGISLHRLVLPSIYTGILNIWTRNETERRLQEEPKDKLFHISMWIKLNNVVILCEKNEVISFKINPKKTANEEEQEARTPYNVRFIDFIEYGRRYIGDDKFFGYSAKDNNCGNWIEYILKANNIDDSHTHDFIGQDTKKILEGFPILRQTLNTVTDIAGRSNVLLEGGQIYEHKNNGLYSDEIENILNKHHYYINGVYSKDEIPKELKNGWYVINMQSTNEGDRHGSHWVCFKYSPEIIEYFDAFGFAPPNEIMQIPTKQGIIYNAKEIQDINASTCGWYCIGCIISKNFNQYINIFSNNTLINDRILSDYLISKNID